MTRITPYLFYEDAEAAVEFLTRALGFGDRLYDGRNPEARIGSSAQAPG